MHGTVAAGHPATAAAGAELLADGGTAVDAAVGAVLASCVAETVMTGLLGGGHAITFEAASGRVRNLDCFVAVPGADGAPMEHLQVRFGEELVDYAVGASSCGVPGVPRLLDTLWHDGGRLPWARIVEPALELARTGVPMPPAHIACLQMLQPVMTLREGAAIYAPTGRLLDSGELMHQPGLVRALELVRDEGAASVYSGTIARELVQLVSERGGPVTGADLAAYEPVWSTPVEAWFAGRRVLTRAGLSGVPETLARLDPSADADGLLAALDEPTTVDGHTTNVTVVDAAGNACVVTTSLGLGSGDWLPGLDLHLNSMLGEVDLLVGALEPGERMQSMMAPTVAVDRHGLALAIGAAGGTRLRAALVGVLAAILDEELEPQDAVDRPRAHAAAGVVNAEPGVDEDALAQLEMSGLAVRRWPALHHYFGGVSAGGRRGAAADPRRSGAVATAPDRA
jgi:gamma-glutamyltranspeptidase/glutathione hydrolase